jgi:hypothetical protein
MTFYADSDDADPSVPVWITLATVMSAGVLALTLALLALCAAGVLFPELLACPWFPLS